MNVEVIEQEVDGLRVLLRANPAQEVVAARFYIRGGSANAAPERAGIETLWARAARRGTRRFAKAALNARLASLGADLGVVAGHDATAFHLRVLARNFAPAWEVFADVLTSPLLAPEELEVVRDQMLLERRAALDSPDGALAEIGRRLVYTGHPYAANPGGSEESLPGIDRAALDAHVGRHLTRTNALLVLVGALGAEDAAACAGAFATLPRGTGPAPLPPRLAFGSPAHAVEARELPTHYVLGEFAAPALRDPDQPALLLALSVLRDRFFEEVRTKRNLSYAPSASLGHDAANLGSIYVTAVDPRTTLGVMRAEMRRLMDEPLPDDELAHKVKTYETRYWMQNETSQAQAGFIAAFDLWGGGWRRSLEFVERLERLAPGDVQGAAHTWLRNIQYAYLGDPERIGAADLIDP